MLFLILCLLEYIYVGLQMVHRLKNIILLLGLYSFSSSIVRTNLVLKILMSFLK